MSIKNIFTNIFLAPNLGGCSKCNNAGKTLVWYIYCIKSNNVYLGLISRERPKLEFAPAIENAKKLALSLQGVGVERFATLKREFNENISESELMALRGLISVLENQAIK